MNRPFDSWKPITEDDDAIASALESANIPTLMMALVHITGDASIIRGDIRPDYSVLYDTTLGLTKDQKAEIRAIALEVLKAYRDAGCPLPAKLAIEQIRPMLGFLTARDLTDDYVEFLMGDLSLGGEDPYQQPGLHLL